MLIKQLDSCGERWGKKIEHNYKRRHFTLLMTLFFGKGGVTPKRLNASYFNYFIEIFCYKYSTRALKCDECSGWGGK